MATNTVVRARIDGRVKDEAAAVLAAIGLTVSDAFRLLMVRVAEEKALLARTDRSLDLLEQRLERTTAQLATLQEELDLCSFFHRGRVSLISSQVSSLAPQLTGRWNNERRLALAWRMLRLVRPANCITHRFALADASLAYSLIDHSPGETIQVIFDHQLTEKR